MGALPDELINDILLLLTVKQLLRFRSVSKHWCYLIDSNNFVKQHLTLSTQNKSKHNLVFFHDQFNLHSLGLFSLDQAKDIVHPINLFPSKTKLIGSCNGLLCLLYPNLNDLIIIWNPATQKHLKVFVTNTIQSYIKSLDGPIVSHGFGYDAVSDDYKVVLTARFRLGTNSTSSESVTCVYSVRSNSWRMVDFSPDYWFCEQLRPDTLVCSAMHWKCFKMEPRFRRPFLFIGAFSFVKEEHTTILLPACLAKDKPHDVFVSELGGCLSVVCNYFSHDGFDVWVMKDYGVRESWTKLLTYSSLGNVNLYDVSAKRVLTLSYLGRGDKVLLLLVGKKLAWYNLENKTFEFVDVGEIPKPLCPVICFESLVSLGDRAEEDEKPDGKKSAKKRISTGSSHMIGLSNCPSTRRPILPIYLRDGYEV